MNKFTEEGEVAQWLAGDLQEGSCIWAGPWTAKPWERDTETRWASAQSPTASQEPAQKPLKFELSPLGSNNIIMFQCSIE